MLAAVLLMFCLAASAEASDLNLTDHQQPVVKNWSGGDHASDLREGGETFSTAMVIPSLPFQDSGATCDNVDDITPPCTESAAPDVVYRFTSTNNMGISLSLCGSGYDTIIAVYDEGLNCIACNDDYCGLQSQVDVYVQTGRTYYFVVDGFGTNCGSYILTIPCCPPQLDCPPGALLEGEPDCHDGYYDSYNGGCQTSGWTPLDPQSEQGCADMCGRSGTYMYEEMNYRDTDWYRAYGSGDVLSVSCTAEFPLQLALIYRADCADLQYDLVQVGEMEQANLSRVIGCGEEVWIWVGPSVFSGVPCGRDYVMHACGLLWNPPGSSGACCLPDGSCVSATAVDCFDSMGGIWLGPCYPCDEDPCAQFPLGACCLPGGECIMVHETGCVYHYQGSYLGDAIPCDPDPCPPVAARRTTWGRIKLGYH